MTHDAFMLAFRRFVSRRGTPMTIYSDNAPTFISANKEIPKSINIHVNWKFIPKAAPWYGGWLERLIGLTKITLKKVLGRSLVTFEVLQTVLTEIECVINDRPITYISSEIRDLQPLTPSQLLHGRTISSYDFSVENNDNRDCLNCEFANRILNRKTLLIEHFAKRWRTEYLTALRESHTEQNKTTETFVKVGVVVQIMDNLPRPMWKFGVIEKTINGNDGFIRAVKIRTTNGLVTTRPIVKLVPLEL